MLCSFYSRMKADFVTQDLSVCLLVSLSISLSDSLLVGCLKKVWMDFDEILWRNWLYTAQDEEVLRFLWQSGIHCHG